MSYMASYREIKERYKGRYREMYLVVHGERVLDAVHREEDVPGEG